MRNAFLVAALALFSIWSLAQVNVTLQSPTPYSTVPAPVQIKAYATTSSGNVITGWHVYVDNQDMYQTQGYNYSTIYPYLSLTPGQHQIVTRAWDNTGAYGDQTFSITVQGTTTVNPLPTPPSNARTYNVDENGSGWGNCSDKNCAGGAYTTDYWMAPYQTSPSLDGSSMEFVLGDNSPAWSNVLWWKHLGVEDAATNLIWDFKFYLSSTATATAQALEWDMYWAQFGYNFMVGTECNIGYKVWDIWDEVAGHWNHLDGTNGLPYVPCPKFSTDTWHHIQWYVTRDPAAKSYTYHTLVVDDKVYNMNITRYAKSVGWGDVLGVQVQLDNNASANGYHEWMDDSNVTVW